MRRYQFTHPHTATVTIEPAAFDHLRRLVEDSNEVIIGDVNVSDPDRWIVSAHCASEAVRERFEDGWS
jgi:hypothetical protein